MKQPWYKIPTCVYKEKSAVIIGGGLAGTSIAYCLAKRNWDVTLIERNEKLATGASGNAAGIVSPLISHKNDIIGKFFLEGFLHSISHINKLANSNTELKHDLCGVLEISTNKVNKNIDNLSIDSNLIEKVTAQGASELSGQNIDKDALYIKGAGWVSPADLCNSNILAFSNMIEVVYNTEALQIQRCENRWLTKSIDGKVISDSEIVIIANSNDANKFQQCKWLPLIPVRGQVTATSNSNINTNKVICYDGGYVIPQINGVNYVGATFNRQCLSVNVMSEEDALNLSNLNLNIGSGVGGIVGSRASLRSTSPDRRPIIGAVPNYEKFMEDYKDLKHGKLNKQYPDGKYLDGFYVSTGFGSRGITGCPLAGEIISALINNEPLPVDKKIIDAVSPARFIIRDLKRGASPQAGQ